MNNKEKIKEILQDYKWQDIYADHTLDEIAQQIAALYHPDQPAEMSLADLSSREILLGIDWRDNFRNQNEYFPKMTAVMKGCKFNKKGEIIRSKNKGWQEYNPSEIYPPKINVKEYFYGMEEEKVEIIKYFEYGKLTKITADGIELPIKDLPINEVNGVIIKTIMTRAEAESKYGKL